MAARHLRLEHGTRNRAIALAVLNGETVPAVAGRWQISRSRCYDLVHAVCLRLEPDLYRSLRSIHGSRPRMAKLREYRDAFSELMDDEAVLTRHSSVRRIPHLPTITLNALLREGVKTVQDLLNCEPEQLKRVPVIGREGLRRIQNALQSIET